MHSFRYACLVHVSPYIAIEHGLYHHPFSQNINFSMMP